MTEASKQLQRRVDMSGYVELLELTNPAFSSPMLIANDTEDFAHKGTSYIGLPFNYKRPDDSSGEHPVMTLTISNLGTAITEELEALPPNDSTYAKLIIVSRERPDHADHTFYMPVVSISVTPTTAAANASVAQKMQQKAGKLVANPFTLPGIF